MDTHDHSPETIQTEAESKTELASDSLIEAKRRLGVAKDTLVVPETIDDSNDEVFRLFHTVMPEPSPDNQNGRGRSEKMDKLVHVIGTSSKFSFDGAAAAVSEALKRRKPETAP